MIAPVFGVIEFSACAGSIWNVSGSMSTATGENPLARIAGYTMPKVYAGTRISEPVSSPEDSRSSLIAVLPPFSATGAGRPRLFSSSDSSEAIMEAVSPAGRCASSALAERDSRVKYTLLRGSAFTLSAKVVFFWYSFN